MPTPVFNSGAVTVSPAGSVSMDDSSEATSVEFWTSMGKWSAHITMLEQRIITLETTLAAHMATPKAHG
jgi:hypothetical protein